MQNKQEKKSELNTSAIPHHQHVQCDIKQEKSHEDVKLTMNNLYTQKIEEKSIQTEDQPKIANLQVENQNQYAIDYNDASKHEDISMHTIEKHSTHHYYNPLKNDLSIFEYMYPPEHGEYPWSTNPDFTNQHSISQITSKLHIQHFNNANIIYLISSSQQLSTSQKNKPIHKMYKKPPRENGEQITQY